MCLRARRCWAAASARSSTGFAASWDPSSGLPAFATHPGRRRRNAATRNRTLLRHAWRSAPDRGSPRGFRNSTRSSEDEAGSKAAVLGEIRNRLGLPVPDGFVLTTEAYRQYCGIPLWEKIRDATHNLDLNDAEAVRRVSESLMQSRNGIPAAPCRRSGDSRRIGGVARHASARWRCVPAPAARATRDPMPASFSAS